MINMSKNKSNMKKRMALLGSVMAVASIPAGAAMNQPKMTYDISIPMVSKYSICIPKALEKESKQVLTSLTFEYINLKKLLTMRTSIPVKILTKYNQELNQKELLYLSGFAECELRAFCADYLESSFTLNMDKNMDVTTKQKERMENACKLRSHLASAFSERGTNDICDHLRGIIKDMNGMLADQNKKVDDFYKLAENERKV